MALNKQNKNKRNKGEKRVKERISGHLKFFSEPNDYGFIVIEGTNDEVFVHYDDLKKTNITRKLLSKSKNVFSIHFNFLVFEYDGKNGKRKSKKAVDIKLV